MGIGKTSAGIMEENGKDLIMKTLNDRSFYVNAN